MRLKKSILELPAEGEENREFREHRRNRLLAQIPPDLLLTDAAKEIREKMEREDNVPENRPPVRVSGWSERYTDENWLQDQGVDTNTPENQELKRLFAPLDEFSSDWRNKNPTGEAADLILPMLEEGYATVTGNTEADQEVVDLLWYKLTACAAILSRVTNNPESFMFSFCRQVLLAGAEHHLPESDLESDVQFDSPMYSPFPRHEAAHGLLRLTFRRSDPEMLDATEKLARDPVPSVRMVTAMELFMVYVNAPGRFWDIVEDRATHETNQVVQGRLCTALGRVITQDEEKTIHSINKILNHTLSSTETLELVESCVNLLMWLAIHRENSWALQTIQDTLFSRPNSVRKLSETCRVLGYEELRRTEKPRNARRT